MNAIQKRYQNEIIPNLKKEFNYKNTLQAPILEKIVVGIGTGNDLGNDKMRETILEEAALITGQKPEIRTARAAVAGFKIRKGQPVGVRVTLRRKRMYDFLEKLITIVLPRARDFRGLKTESFDKKGNYTLGFKENIVFPEVNTAQTTPLRGLEITIVTRSKSKEESQRLLELFGMPFRKGVK